MVLISGRDFLILLLYIREPIVPLVPIMPTFPPLYFLPTYSTTGSITFTTGTLSCKYSLVLLYPKEEAVLHAITIVLQPLFKRKLAILLEYNRIDSGDLSPYGKWAVSPK